MGCQKPVCRNALSSPWAAQGLERRLLEQGVVALDQGKHLGREDEEAAVDKATFIAAAFR